MHATPRPACHALEQAVLDFGPLKGARNKVLRRVDAVHGFIYDCSNNQVGAGMPMRRLSLQQAQGTWDLHPLPLCAPRHTRCTLFPSVVYVFGFRGRRSR